MSEFTEDVFLIWLGATINSGLIVFLGGWGLVIPITRVWLGLTILFLLGGML